MRDVKCTIFANSVSGTFASARVRSASNKFFGVALNPSSTAGFFNLLLLTENDFTCTKFANRQRKLEPLLRLRFDQLKKIWRGPKSQRGWVSLPCGGGWCEGELTNYTV